MKHKEPVEEQSLGKFADKHEASVGNLFSTWIKSVSVPAQVDHVYLEGPNILFKQGNLEFGISYIRYKDNTEHGQFTNVVGYGRIIFTVSKLDSPETIERRFKRASSVIQALWTQDVWFEREGESSYLAVL